MAMKHDGQSNDGAKDREAFEMFLYRRILKISWAPKITNEEVLTVKRRKTSYCILVTYREANDTKS